MVAQTRQRAPEYGDVEARPVRVLPGFLSELERKKLLRAASKPKAKWDVSLPESDVWHGRMMNPEALPKHVVDAMLGIRSRIARDIAATYRTRHPMWADTLQLVRWRPGDAQAPHADAEEPDGSPNPFPWRAFGAIAYLNDNFEGGELHFPTLGLEPETAPGTVAYFPSSHHYLHGVTEVTKGVRYTMSMFFTHDALKSDGLPC